MARICNSRAKMYESRGVISDEPLEHIESEGERLIKQMVQKQLDTHANLEQELKREKIFKSVADTLPLTEYICGETTLREFEQSAEKASYIEELRSLGLSNDEIQILLNYEKDILTEKYKKTDKSILSARLHNILEKIESARKERGDFQERSSSNINRHQRELGLCVKPESEHTKLLNFVLSCQKAKSDARPLNHPINNLKDIEEELFGHLSKNHKKSIPYRYVKTSSASKRTVPQIYSYKQGTSLWDVKPEIVDVSNLRKSAQPSEHIYTCKPEYLYTIKNGEIIPMCHSLKKEKIFPNNTNETERQSDEYVVSDIKQSTIPLIPLETISRNCLSLQEIKSISKFSCYTEGIPSQVLYVKNLAGSVTKDDLVSLFGHFEKNCVSRIVYRLLTGRMRGQAFITFPSTSLAENAMKLVNGYVLKGKPMILHYGKGKGVTET